MIDPMTRWAAYGEKPDYAGLPTYGGLPYTEDPAELVAGAHLEVGVDALRTALRVVDFGDAPILPADPVRSHEAIRNTVAQVLAAGAIPIILGGDHSIAEPDIRACAEVHGPVGLIHFDTHTDTGREVFGATLSHGSCMYRLVESGHIDPERYVQIGLRGYWPGAEEFAWQQERGIVSHFMHDVRDRGIRAVVADAIAHVGAGPVFLSVDIDVLDPAFAPGTGTPEPGGMTSGDLLLACREIARDVRLVGAEIVEVLPDRIGSRDITALVAERVVRETLTGVALARVQQPALSGNAP
jgi:agmatinase